MLCPRCGSARHCVKDTRASGPFIYRRRACHDCDKRFTTFEMAVPDAVRAHCVADCVLNADLWRTSVLGRIEEIESILLTIKEPV